MQGQQLGGGPWCCLELQKNLTTAPSAMLPSKPSTYIFILRVVRSNWKEYARLSEGNIRERYKGVGGWGVREPKSVLRASWSINSSAEAAGHHATHPATAAASCNPSCAGTQQNHAVCKGKRPSKKCFLNGHRPFRGGGGRSPPGWFGPF